MEQEDKVLREINGGVTDEQLTAWKRRYGKVMIVEIEEDDELHKVYLHRPSLDTMAAVSKIGKTNDVESAKVMLANCWLGGSEAVKDDAVLFMEATKQLSKIFERCTSRLKNL